MRRFRVNEPSVVFEAFDQEIVAVNLDAGNYYSISRTGPRIWMDIVSGFSLEEIVDRIQHRHTGECATIRSEVMDFIDQLAAEQLVVEGSGRLACVDDTMELVANKTAFEAPVIENYSDMQDLLMLDPIYDVDPAGWPVAKKNP